MVHPLIKLTRWYFHHFPLVYGKYRFREGLRSIFQNRKFLAEIEDGVCIYLSLAEPMEAHLFFEGVYEPNVLNCFKALLRPTDIVIDAGANVGLYTLVAAKKLKAGGKLFAFEPSPPIYRALQRNVAANKFAAMVTLAPLGLSNRTGEQILHLSTEPNQGLHTFAAPGFASKPILVSVQRLDGYLAQKGIRSIDILKIDVEGWEYPVLQGCGRLLSQPQRPWILFEACDQHAWAGGYALPQLKTYLAQQGYTLFKITTDQVLVRTSFEASHIFDYLLAMPPSAAASLNKAYISYDQLSQYRVQSD